MADHETKLGDTESGPPFRKVIIRKFERRAVTLTRLYQDNKPRAFDLDAPQKTPISYQGAEPWYGPRLRRQSRTDRRWTLQ